MTALHSRCNVAVGPVIVHACCVLWHHACVLQGCAVATQTSFFCLAHVCQAKMYACSVVRGSQPRRRGRTRMVLRRGRAVWQLAREAHGRALSMLLPCPGCLICVFHCVHVCYRCLSASPLVRVRCCMGGEDDVGGPSSENWVRWLGWGDATSGRGTATTSQTPLQGYCAPRVDYGEVRLRVANAYAEKSHEFVEMVNVIQSLSKDIARTTGALCARCS